MQINSVTRTTDKSVSADITILANVTDNEARYRCEAHNSATEIPLFESKTLSVHCKCVFPIFHLFFSIMYNTAYYNYNGQYRQLGTVVVTYLKQLYSLYTIKRVQKKIEKIYFCFGGTRGLN